MSTTDLRVTKTGLVRRRYGLARADGPALGAIDLGPRRGAWTGPDGATWEFWTDLQLWISTTDGGRRRIESGVRDDGRYLRVSGVRYRMSFDPEGGRWARLRSADGQQVVLHATIPEPARGGPFRTISVRDDVPDALAVAAHVAFRQIYAYEDLRLAASASGGSTGPAN